MEKKWLVAKKNIFIIIIIVIIIWISSYLLSSKDNNKNYEFYANADIEFIKNSKIQETANIDISKWEILSQDSGLQQRIKIESFNAKMVENNTPSSIEIKDLDIISNYQDIYMYLWEAWIKSDFLSQLIEENVSDFPLKTWLEQSGSWKYIMIDNAEPIINIFWKLAENEILKEVVVGLATSNPQAYYEKYNTNKQLLSYFQSDKFLDYIFTTNELNDITKTASLQINNQVCLDYSEVIISAIKDIPEFNTIIWNDSNNDIQQTCSMVIEQINSLLPMFMKITKTWDIENGNFTFSIIQGNIVNIEIVYSNHNISTWFVDIKSPNEDVALTIQWNKNKILSSIMNFDINIQGFQIIWSIIDGKGEVKISGEEKDMYTLNGNIIFHKYIPTSYDIVANYDYFGMKADAIAKWNLISWAINILATQGEDQLLKADISYKAKQHNINILSDFINISSIYSPKKYSYVQSDWLDNIIYSVYYEDGKIEGKFEDVLLNGTFNNIQDFNIELSQKKEKYNFSADGSTLTWLNYNFSFTEDQDEIASLKAIIKKSQENWYNLYNLNLNGWELNQDKTLNNGLTLNINFGYKKSNLEYFIPQDFTKQDINIMQTVQLPNFYEIPQFWIQEKVILWIGATAWVSTIAFISLNWYAQDAKNSKINSDIRSLISAIEVNLIQWNITYDELVLQESHSDFAWSQVIINEQKFTAGREYKVWKINFDALGLNKYDFQAPDGSDYYISTISSWSIAMYQLMGFLENGNNFEAKIRWTYYQRDENDSESLFFQYNQNIKDWDSILTY